LNLFLPSPTFSFSVHNNMIFHSSRMHSSHSLSCHKVTLKTFSHKIIKCQWDQTVR